MAERMAWPPRDDEALASALAEVAQAVAFPPTPRIAQAVAAQERLLCVRLRTHLPDRDAALRHRHRARERAADVEAAAEDLPHVAHFVEVVPDEA